MRLKNKIEKRLVKLNAFLESGEKPTPKGIHGLRLEVKRLKAFLELMTIQSSFEAKAEIPNRLEELFHEAGKLRKYGLEMKAVKSITDHNGLAKPTRFLQQLSVSEKKSSNKLLKKRKTYSAFKPGDFAKHPEVRLSSDTWRSFMSARASSILDLFKQDILSDIRSLHELRKILKSIIYIMPVCKNSAHPVLVFLKTRKKLIESVESKIGSMHDTQFFITWMEKQHILLSTREEADLKKIKREWQHDMVSMRKDIKPLLPTVRQFALDLQDHSANGRLQLTVDH